MPPRADAVPAPWLVPDWNVDARVRGFVTTRHGGVSHAPFAGLNLGRGASGATHDDPQAVEENRRRVAAHLPGSARWLRQVHGTAVLDADDMPAGAHADAPPSADAAVTRCANVPLVVLVADCLPVLLAARDGTVIGVAHAGWRGLAAGVHAVRGGGWCTVEDRARFFSYRRDGATGRMGAFLWIAASDDARLPDTTRAEAARS
jgi:copper oxidase (laccase) domain-containing protein